MSPHFLLFRQSLSAILLWGFFCLPANAVTPAPAYDATSLRIGPQLQIIHPSGLPGFFTPVPAYGAAFVVPISIVHLHLQGGYANAEGVSLFLGEATARFTLYTPFFSPALLAGVQYLGYVSFNTPQNFVGGHVGIGLPVHLDKNLDLFLGLKVYLQENRMVTLSGALLFAI